MARRVLLLIACVLVACGDPPAPHHGQDAGLDAAGAQLAPSGLTYTVNPAVYAKGVAIASNAPASTGGAVESYAIVPASLPAGLDFDSSTGVLSGTPAVASPKRVYTVTASNAAGSTSALLAITVLEAPPAGLTYSTNPAMYVVGMPITANTPSSTGGAVTSYAIAPALPAGLKLDVVSGAITGTPSAGSPATTYQVTATNAGGSTTASLTISVRALDVTGMVAAGGERTCAIVNDGAMCWGRNSEGELGDGTMMQRDTPVAVTGLTSGVTAIEIGGDYTCAIVSGGARCWGRNTFGQLGNNSTTSSQVPVAVTNLTSGVTALAAGAAHACALVNGGVVCWGINDRGQLGNNSTTNSLVPVQVSGLTSGVQAISASGSHTCALVNGAAKCWGANTLGQLGDNSSIDRHVPVQVSGLTTDMQAISASGIHTCAIRNGGLQCWGGNAQGQLGTNSIDNSAVPVQVVGLTAGVQAVSLGGSHTCAIVNGGAWCWGLSFYGQLGNNNSAMTSHVPSAVYGLSSGVEAIVAGSNHSCALVPSGLACWGFNLRGQLGTGTTVDSSVPLPVMYLTNGP